MSKSRPQISACRPSVLCCGTTTLGEQLCLDLHFHDHSTFSQEITGAARILIVASHTRLQVAELKREISIWSRTLRQQPRTTREEKSFCSKLEAKINELEMLIEEAE
jgi:hypothetical protein